MTDSTRTWDAETDFVVIGSGGAGLTGALVAAVEGLQTMVIEKTGLIGGTTSVSGGGFWIADNHHMPEVDVPDSRDDALAYLRACVGDEAGDPGILEAWVDHGKEMVRYLEDQGGQWFRPWGTVGGTIDYRGDLPGAKHGGRTLDAGKVESAPLGEWKDKLRIGPQSAWVMDKHDYYAGKMHALPPPKEGGPARRFFVNNVGTPEHLSSGTALIAGLLRGCLERGVDVQIECPAKELIVEDGQVIGVEATRQGAPFRVRARRGVLMSTGGYAHNEELKRLWMHRPLHQSCEIKDNQGDGHLMGMAIGAQTANLGDAWWMPYLIGGEVEPGGETYASLQVVGSREDRILPHTMIVNTRGKRFVNEALNYNDVVEGFGTKQGEPANVPAYFVWDSQAREKYTAIAAKHPPADEPQPAWFYRGDTLADLAAAIGVDPAGLDIEAGKMGRYAASGVDEDFGRGAGAWDRAWGDERQTPNPCLGSIEKGPFFAMEIQPGALATKGGLRVNEFAEVLSAGLGQRAIGGFYAAGNCSSANAPHAYPGAGATIGVGMTFAYIAARRAAGTL
ncbi:MAG TPA: FAD-dependent oxidoreductase [Ilumatobacter sp.]|nr:FAD-dependent oxidoreductase [Ilumatobacter sp.]